jgi:hypothetical protein
MSVPFTIESLESLTYVSRAPHSGHLIPPFPIFVIPFSIPIEFFFCTPVCIPSYLRESPNKQVNEEHEYTTNKPPHSLHLNPNLL